MKSYEECDCLNGSIGTEQCNECDFNELNGGTNEDSELFILEEELKHQGFDYINKGIFE